MTGGANLDKEVFAERRTRREFVTATAGHLDFTIVRMDVGFHCLALLGTLGAKRARNINASGDRRKPPSFLALLSTDPVDNSVEYF